jgi:hypothetical protein
MYTILASGAYFIGLWLYFGHARKYSYGCTKVLGRREEKNPLAIPDLILYNWFGEIVS